MKISNQFQKNIEKFLKVALTFIAHKDSPNIRVARDTYDFDNELKRTNEYFLGWYLLRELVLDKEKELRYKINDNSSQTLFEALVEAIYEKIKERDEKVTTTLSNHFENGDLKFATNFMKKILVESHDKYSIILITDLIDLLDINRFQVGNVEIAKINEDFINNLPEQIEDYLGLLGILAKENGGYPNYRTKENFLEQNKKYIALSVGITGFHHNRERSIVFEEALSEFKQVFAYLAYAKHFFANKKKKVFQIKTRSPEYRGFTAKPSIMQTYYVGKQRHNDTLKMIDTRWFDIELFNEIFLIDSETVRQLNELCYLKEYNYLIENIVGNQIAGKVKRAFDWFLKANLEDNSTDELVSLFIGLESLLSSGPDPFRGSTDDLAENVAILMTRSPEQRYSFKKEVRDAYSLRCKVVHAGEIIKREKDFFTIIQLRNYVVWSLRGILSRLDQIFKYGNKVKHLQEYFDREKLKGGISIPPKPNL